MIPFEADYRLFPFVANYTLIPCVADYKLIPFVGRAGGTLNALIPFVADYKLIPFVADCTVIIFVEASWRPPLLLREVPFPLWEVSPGRPSKAAMRKQGHRGRPQREALGAALGVSPRGGPQV